MSPLKCEGKARVRLIADGRKTIETEAIVCGDMGREVILSRSILRRMRIIPKNFPNVFVAGVKNCVNDLISEFPETLSDRLPKKPMKGKPMRIYLKDDVDIVPTRRLTARQIPLARQEAAENVVTKLMEDRVIERVEGPTDWISPGFFVPKNDGKGVRLVTDYT
ncbi:Hypothetical predicted protein, partial [Paramuricea clavata]